MPQCYGRGARSGRAAVARVQHRRQARLAAPLERHPGGTRGPPGGDRRRTSPQLGDDRARASRRAIVDVLVLFPGHRGAGARAEALGLLSSHDGGAGDARERGSGPRTCSIERRDVVRGHAGQERRCEPIGDEPPSRRAAPLIGRILPDFQFSTFELSLPTQFSTRHFPSIHLPARRLTLRARLPQATPPRSNRSIQAPSARRPRSADPNPRSPRRPTLPSSAEWTRGTIGCARRRARTRRPWMRAKISSHPGGEEH